MDIHNLLNETANKLKAQLALSIQSKQSIISSNLTNIEVLSTYGVSYKKLLEHCENPISLKHFHDLIYRAKKKRANDQGDIPIHALQPHTTVLSGQPNRYKTESPSTSMVQIYSDAAWMAAGVNNDYLLNAVTHTDLTPDEVNSWHCPNTVQLSKRISEYRQRKMRRKQSCI
ncbi:hypothetical protein [Vibrio hepatarius]|uniref:hypothetical protein n=1 Tax=Vibrio hepatarius TaxID=171383 RepID=UPI00142E6751|nr:hypothetical protein [Vibrio hepatarius]NIY83691.1 hypothetical protein [Vibrio hepatarius]